MKNHKNIHVVILRAAAVLLVLTMLSTGMVAGRFARYTASAIGEDGARVAKFAVSSNMEVNMPVRIAPGETVKTTITVKNDSEVAVSYAVSAENLYHNLPLQISLRAGDAEGTEIDVAAGEEKKLTLQIYWDEAETSDAYIGMVDLIHLTFTATQID